jgi:hypothetical protein
VTTEAALNQARKLRDTALSPDVDRVAILDAADSLEHLADTINNLRRTRDDLEAIISNLRAKLHHLQMVDSGE